jgi:hypothetical protein
MAQLTMVFDPTGTKDRLSQAQVFSYGSLMLFRLLKESSLPYREALRIMRSLAPHLLIWVIQHQDEPHAAKYCVLRRAPDGSDVLEIAYTASDEEKRRRTTHERQILGAIRALGCWPLKVVHAPHGSSVHYASQLPMTRDNRPLTTEPSGRLRGTRSVFVVDGAALAYLPAKGLTFTLMANANRVATAVARGLN